jgi:hypothetical protein
MRLYAEMLAVIASVTDEGHVFRELLQRLDFCFFFPLVLLYESS